MSCRCTARISHLGPRPPAAPRDVAQTDGTEAAVAVCFPRAKGRGEGSRRGRARGSAPTRPARRLFPVRRATARIDNASPEHWDVASETPQLRLRRGLRGFRQDGRVLLPVYWTPCSGAWTRTTIQGFKVPCPAIRRHRKNFRAGYLPNQRRRQQCRSASALHFSSSPPAGGAPAGSVRVPSRRAGQTNGDFLVGSELPSGRSVQPTKDYIRLPHVTRLG